MVSNGLDWPPEWHKFATNDTNTAQNPTGEYGTVSCPEYRKKIFQRHFQLAEYLSLDYLRHAEEKNYVEANKRLYQFDAQLNFGNHSLSDTVESLKEYCTGLAHHFTLVSADRGPDKVWPHCLEILNEHRLDPPSTDNRGAAIARLCDAQWWFKCAERKRIQVLDGIARDMGIVQSHRHTYASDLAVHRRHHQTIGHRRYLESHILINDSGEEFSLWEIQQRSISNPVVRRAELMVRIKGFEMVADVAGHIGEFYTISAPGCMHASRKSGQRNQHFIGSTPSEIQRYLNHTWALIRAELHRQDIRPYGFRVVEPHHDGTPHWHFLLFMESDVKDKVRAIFRKYSLLEYPDEKGASKHRFKAIGIDPSKGSAAGYIAKYVAKNIDGEHLDKSLEGYDAKQAATRIRAWAGTWGIRQFQQIGGPSVTVWRELRRLKEENGSTDVEGARSAADASDWAAFCVAMGGISLPRSQRPIQPLYLSPLITDSTTGEITDERRTRYGDLAAPRLIGIQFDRGEIRTRNHHWTLKSARPPPDG